MKKQATVIALGALLTLAMTASLFAQGNSHPTHHARAAATSPYSGYYDSAVPEGNYTGYSNSYTGGISGAIGGVGR
jgi:hypothetical protein